MPLVFLHQSQHKIVGGRHEYTVCMLMGMSVREKDEAMYKIMMKHGGQLV
jgi:hypothetical protein